MEPTTPEMHWAMTSFGLLMMNSGEPMMGRGKFFKAPGNLDMQVSNSLFTHKTGHFLPIAGVFIALNAIINVAN
jgi:hypothetical protein